MTAQQEKSAHWVFVLMFAGVLALAAILRFESAHGAPELKIETPYARVTIPGRPAAGYLKIHNSGAAPDALVSASSPMAERVELHTHLMENGVMKMRQVEKVEVPAGGEAAFEPGGYHLMIFGLDKAVKPGTTLPLTLSFEKAGGLDVEFRVEGIGQ